MRLLTHNILACHVKKCDSNNFPLALSDCEIKETSTEVNEAFLRNFLPKLDYPVLVATARALGKTDLPEEASFELLQDPDQTFLQQLHSTLMDLHVTSGQMTCPNCGHIYPIRNGIPNMLLTPEEV